MGQARQQGIDPQSLLDPTSPNYWPKPERVKQYQDFVNDPANMNALYGILPTGPGATAAPNGMPPPPGANDPAAAYRRMQQLGGAGGT
jgi:hypothetical protein